MSGRRTHTKPGHMRDVCPRCCVADGRVLGTSGFTADWDEDTAAPTWECNNCGTTVPRRLRRSKGKIALDKLRQTEEQS